MKMRILPRYGFWIIDKHPVGGDFGRTGDEGLIVTVTRKLPGGPASRFMDMEGVTDTGMKVVFNSENAEIEE